MNAENAKDYLPLVQALADGKTIQFQPKGEIPGTIRFPRNTWTDMPKDQGINLPYSPDCYRVKPEPFEAWVWKKTSTNSLYAVQPEHDPAYWKRIGYIKIRMREVVEE